MESSDKPVKLMVTAEGRPDRVVEIGERLTIGRSAGNNLVLDDTRASRNHAEIRHVGGGGYQLTDLGSSNGTWLNGQRVAVPRQLADGDIIVIGHVHMRFSAGAVASKRDKTFSAGTALEMRHETVVILVSDVRNYTRMSQLLPTREFSGLIADWFRDVTEIIRASAGTVDKFIGDAVMAYWVVADPAQPSPEVTAALTATRSLLARADRFSARLAAEFPGHEFRVGIGLNLGDALHGNVGTGEVQSFTVVGDTVNVAFRLETATKELGETVLVGAAISRHASRPFKFRALGEVTVKGRPEPVAVCAVDFEPVSDTRTVPI